MIQGSFSMIGAGSVVTKSVPDFAVVVGNPAKILGYACVCGNIILKVKNLKRKIFLVKKLFAKNVAEYINMKMKKLSLSVINEKPDESEYR